MNTIHESSIGKGTAHVSCIKYENCNNLSHYHSDYELVYVDAGSARVVVDENIFNLNEKESLFIHSNEIHCIQSDERSVITVLKAASAHFDVILASKKLSSARLSVSPEGMLEDIISELKLGGENSVLMLDSIVTQFFIRMLRGQPVESLNADRGTKEKSSATEVYNEICKKISTEYSTITFSEAAKYMHFSEPYFAKLFHKIFGMTFTQYLNTVRVAAAIEKLKRGDMSITEISVSCGFNTIRNFNRVFKSLTGYSPSTMPNDYVFLYTLSDGYGLDPTLNSTRIIE